MTWLDDIPVEEVLVVDELRKRTIDDCTPKMLEDPALFYRFLKARNFNLKNAEAMLRKHIQWRKELEVDTILTDYKTPEVLQKYFSTGHIGFDKEGCPVSYSSVFKMDTNGIIKSCRDIDFLKQCICVTNRDLEKMFERNHKTGEFISRIVYIYDMVGMTIAKATHKKSLEIVMEWITMFQNNFPERMKTVYVINAPSYFSVLFAIVKIVISSDLLKKIQIVGPEKVKETLLETIDADVLPAFLGGNRTDPDGDPLCKTFICHGGTIPTQYYLSKKSIKQEDNVEYLCVLRNSQVEIVVNVEVPGSALMWEFETTNKDIGFGVYFQTDAGEFIELICKKRIETTWAPEMGLHACEKSGSYVLIFDNTYSWFYTKEIYYRIKIILPTTE
ncbi:SEC14-like protein 2 [Parasteatoda tepidariorum]|uniref:SEC14-like protein 2 n=1 Tax=Parasteatoda tepidariorum TaxID=114398 RepID=UPI0039BC88AF